MDNTLSRWNDLIHQAIELCGPAEYRRFIHADDLAQVEVGEVAGLYHSMPLLLLTAGMFNVAMAFPDSDLSAMAEGLERLWQSVIDERDTSALSGRDEEEDEAFVDVLEDLRDETDGLLAVFEAYTANDLPTESDVNPLIQQVILLTSSNLAQARRLFGRAGAAILRGAHSWPMWHTEAEMAPASNWLKGLSSLTTYLKVSDLYPLAEITEQRQKFTDQVAEQPGLPEPPDDVSELLEEKLSPEEQRLMDILLCGDEKLTDEQLAVLPPSTPEIIARLITVLTDEEYAFEESPGKGYAPIHATRLLGESGLLETVQPLLQALYNSDVEDVLSGAAMHALEALGPLALPAVLESMQYSTDPDFKLLLAEVLGKIGRGDEHAFRALEAFYHEATWDDDRVMAVADLAELGDPRALPLLHKALNERDITAMGINEVIGAIEELDPDHDPAEIKRLQTKARQRYDSRRVRFDKYGKAFCRDCGGLMHKGPFGEWVHVEPESRPEPPPLRGRSAPPVLQAIPPALDPRFKNVGRNAPCPCGSGKKFKHCHGAGRTIN